MFFAGFQKLTLLDYPEKVACILFTMGCNFRCPFCHNASLVRAEEKPQITEEEVLAFLKKRQGILEGVCISGGEPLLYDGLGDFIKKVKALGYNVKLDTNGSFPERLKALVREGLVDYVAMDIKNSFERYEKTVGIKTDLNNIKESIDFLMSGEVEYEFRTTLVKELHTPEDMEIIGNIIKGAKRYFLQNFVDSGDVLCENMHPLTENELEKMLQIAKKYVPNTICRGV